MLKYFRNLLEKREVYKQKMKDHFEYFEYTSWAGSGTKLSFEEYMNIKEYILKKERGNDKREGSSEGQATRQVGGANSTAQETFREIQIDRL